MDTFHCNITSGTRFDISIILSFYALLCYAINRLSFEIAIYKTAISIIDYRFLVFSYTFKLVYLLLRECYEPLWQKDICVAKM